MRPAQQTRFVRRATNGVNGFVLEQQDLVGRLGFFAFLGDDFFLKFECISKCDASKPTNAKLVHICFAPGIPIRAASCARMWVRPIASASAASASGVSVKPRSARTMNAT